MIGRRISIAATLLFLVLLALRPEAAGEGAAAGLRLCAGTLIPALFPFSVASGVLVRMGFGANPSAFADNWMQRCFGLPGVAALPLLLGFLGGYPLGAQILADQVRAGTIPKQDAVRLSAFCSNAGPGFILGAVAPAVLGSTVLGAVLLLIHVLSALITGILMRGPRTPSTQNRKLRRKSLPFSSAFPEALSASASAMVRVTGAVVFFSVLNRLLPAAASDLPAWTGSLIRGVLELSGGIFGLQSTSSALAFPICALLLGWGGLCVHLQTAQLFLSAGIPMRRYLFGKLLQASISFFLAAGFPALCG